MFYMTIQTVIKNQGLIKAFKRYQKRYLTMNKKPNIAKLLPEVLFRTIKLENDPITRKQAKALFK